MAGLDVDLSARYVDRPRGPDLDRVQPQGLQVAGRQRYVLAELKDWDPSCGIATPSAASAIFFLSSVVSGVGEWRRLELRNLNGLFEIFVAVSSRSPCIRSAKILEGSGDESRFH